MNSNNNKEEDNMARIEYSAIHPKFAEFINSDEFKAVLAANPNLRLVTFGEDDEDGNELLIDATLPMPEGSDKFVGVMNADGILWVLHDSYCIVKDPSPEFIAVLKVMDAYYAKTLNQRIFTREGQFAWLPVSEAEMLAVEYDFTTGEYLF